MGQLPVVFTSSSCAEALWSRATWNVRCAHHATNAGHHEFEYTGPWSCPFMALYLSGRQNSTRKNTAEDMLAILHAVVLQTF